MFTSNHNWKQEKETIEGLIKELKTNTEIAKHYNVSKQRITQVFKKLNIEYSSFKEKRALKDLKYYQKYGNRKEDILWALKRKKFRDKKRNAIENGIEFTLEYSEIVWPVVCPILGVPIDYSHSGGDYIASFDRYNPKLGYTKENTIIISNRANRIKNNATTDELYLIYSFMKDRDTQLDC